MVTRPWLATAVAALALALPACSADAEETVSPSALASPTAAPPTAAATPEPGPTRMATGPCPSRGEVMSVERARAVAAEPLTGETWLAAPVAIATPTPFMDTSDYDEWYEVGTRDGADILAGYGWPGSLVLVERAADGSLTLIDAPVPGDGARESWVPDGVATDADQCYESLSLPATIDLVDGVQVASATVLSNVVSAPFGDETAALADLGGGELYRVNTSYDSSLIAESGIQFELPAVTFAMALPFGGWADIYFNPLAGVEAVVPGSWVDYPDYACAGVPVYQVHVSDGAPGDWTVVGTLRGRDVAVPTADNPYAQERYAAYKAIKLSWGETPVSFDDYLAAPGLVALAADEGGWWLGITTELSPRAWC